jgi:hypothetical protein
MTGIGNNRSATISIQLASHPSSWHYVILRVTPGERGGLLRKVLGRGWVDRPDLSEESPTLPVALRLLADRIERGA